jgi:hypothetical protein
LRPPGRSTRSTAIASGRSATIASQHVKKLAAAAVTCQIIGSTPNHTDLSCCEFGRCSAFLLYCQAQAFPVYITTDRETLGKLPTPRTGKLRQPEPEAEPIVCAQSWQYARSSRSARKRVRQHPRQPRIPFHGAAITCRQHASAARSLANITLRCCGFPNCNSTSKTHTAIVG